MTDRTDLVYIPRPGRLAVVLALVYRLWWVTAGRLSRLPEHGRLWRFTLWLAIYAWYVEEWRLWIELRVVEV